MHNPVSRGPQRAPLIALAIGAVAIASAATAAWLFPRALPIVALERTLTRDGALTRAEE